MVILILVIVLKFPTSLVINTFNSWQHGDKIFRLQPQLIPFKTIIDYLDQVQAVHDWFFKNLAANVIMFIPFGLLYPLCIKNNRHLGVKIIMSGIMLSVFIELFQYIAAIGQCDIDDVILNTAGVVLGLLLYNTIRRLCHK